MSSLYASLLGPAWSALDPPVQRLHGAAAAARGVFAIRRGRGPARLLASLLGMPPEAEGLSVQLAVDRTADTELWTRRFGDCLVRTWQWARGGLLVEGMGPVQVWFRLRADAGALVFEHVRTTLGARRFSIPIPRALGPRVVGRASCEDGSVHVDIRISMAILGLVIAYEGLVAAEDIA